VHELRKRFASTDTFFYIADSAAFTKAFLKKVIDMEIHVITRMLGNILLVKAAFKKALEQFNNLETIEIPTASTPLVSAYSLAKKMQTVK
jgi:heme oxygenase